MNTLNTRAAKFAAALSQAQHYRNYTVATDSRADTFHVVGAGGTISVLYEQIRNAAEYSEDHLLLQRAIRRFYTRLFITGDIKQLEESGSELITELTLSGYLANDSVPLSKVDVLTQTAADYYAAYGTIDKSSRIVQSWVVDVLAIEVHSHLTDYLVRETFEQFVFEQFKSSIDTASLYGKKVPEDYELLLFIAVHRAILKSDDATIRWALLRRFASTPRKLAEYQRRNKVIDDLLTTKDNKRLQRMVNREGAVFRILWQTIERNDDVVALMEKPGSFLQMFEDTVNMTYEDIEHRMNRGVVRSILFLIITKAIIGVAIEVPYDLWVHGEIAWLPLAVNLALPPLYMLLLRLTLLMPGTVNTRALVSQADTLLYGKKQPTYEAPKTSGQYGAIFNIVYTLLIIGIFGIASWLLMQIGFTIVHLAIFFVFFCTASFLGFRLSRNIRDVETVENGINSVVMVRDFIYLPFAVVGQKLSQGYAKFNIIAIILDMVIELPLKAVLGLIRRWGSFISSKKDEL